MHLFENRSRFRLRGIAVSVLLCALLAVLFVGMLGQVEVKTDAQQTETLENALHRAAITCYAVEGHYPPTLDYMVKHYGVVIDEEKYSVGYDAFASNFFPSIRVFVRGAED